MAIPSVGPRRLPAPESTGAAAGSTTARYFGSGPLTFAPILAVFLGYALRIWRVSAFSVTGDEMDSLLFAAMPFRQLFGALATREPHPPFYYVLLHLWVPLAGQSELALRYPSVLFGALGVASAYNAGRTVGGRSAGLAAAAILATSQFSVLHAQEGRMYAILQAWVALFLAALLHQIRRPSRTGGFILALAGAMAAFTHYHGLLLVVLGGCTVLLTVPWRSWWTQTRPFLAIGAVYAPWVVFARHIFLDYHGWMAVVPPLEIVRRSVETYSLGTGVDGVPGRLALAILPGFAVAGLAALAWRGQGRWIVVLLGLGVLPLIAVMAGSATGRPLYHERYLIVITPAYVVIAGAGLAFLCRRIVTRPVGLAGLVALAVVSLRAYYWPTTVPSPDYRATVAFIESEARPGDELLLSDPEVLATRYYLKGRLPSYAAPFQPSPEEVARALSTELAGRGEVWFIRYGSDLGDETIGRWLEANAFFLKSRWITQNYVATYILAPPGGTVDRPITAALSNGLKITDERRGVGAVRPGEPVLVGFRWTPAVTGANTPPTNTKVSLRLIDPLGEVVTMLDRPVINPAQLVHVDALPVWQGALTVPPDAIPGTYHLEARFYDGQSGQAITVTKTSGQKSAALDLGATTVDPTDQSALVHAPRLDPSAVALGSGIFAQGIALQVTPSPQYSRLVATFDWASQADQTGPVIPEIAVRSASGQIIATARRSEADQPYPLRRLRAGERMRERLVLPLRAVTLSGVYRVVLRTAADRPWTDLGSIRITVDPNRARVLPLAQARSDLFDGAVRLVGATIPTRPVPAGSLVPVTLAWAAERHPTDQYTVFVHLARGAGAPVAQSDGVPGGEGQTTDWVPGDEIVDQHRIAVPRALPPGDYRLTAGLYVADTGRRAKVVGPSSDGQMVELGKVTITAP